MTLTPRRAFTELEKAEQSLAALKANAFTAAHAMQDRINEPNVYGAGGSDVAVHTSRGDSIVERAWGTTLGVTQQLDDLAEHIRAIQAVIHDANDIVRPWVPPLDGHDLGQRCIGTGDEHGATCGQWAEEHGRCLDCNRKVEAARKRKVEADRKRRQRHRAA